MGNMPPSAQWKPLEDALAGVLVRLHDAHAGAADAAAQSIPDATPAEGQTQRQRAGVPAMNLSRTANVKRADGDNNRGGSFK
jgi:hypothetical protein